MGEAAQCAVKMHHVTKTFGKVIANKDINLELKNGEILALLGENGSGKTTLMNMLSGIYFPDHGEIYVKGEEVTIRSPKDSFALGIGMIHQHFKLVDVLTAAENIVLGLDGKAMLNLRRSAAGFRNWQNVMDSKWIRRRRSTICLCRRSRRWRSSKCCTGALIF